MQSLKEYLETVERNSKLFIDSEISFIEDDNYATVDILPNNFSKLREGRAYIINDSIYVYRGKPEKNQEIKPGLYDVHGSIYINLVTESNQDNYLLDKLVEVDLGHIREELESNKDDFISQEEIELINASGDVYRPTINESDDFLKKVIKTAIIKKNINIKLYASKFAAKHKLDNLLSVIKKDETGLSIKRFMQFCELLDLNFKLTVSDNGADKWFPLGDSIEFNSDEQFDPEKYIISSNIEEDEDEEDFD